jgi:saccharopine dehydrogenase-like NADP-dependent oxidoreductase
MKTVVVLGAGKIGRMVSHFLVHSGDYRVRVGDVSQAAVASITSKLGAAEGRRVDFSSETELDAILDGAYAVVSCAPFHCNPRIAERAKGKGVHYLDLTEDVAVTQRIKELAAGAKTALIPQCGLAPGFITICAVHLMAGLREVRDLRLRVGALPRYPSNIFRYNLTWSTEGLINEYCRPCEVVIDGVKCTVPPLEGLETFVVDGVEYEAFNTSGGLSTLAASLEGAVRNVDYKSIRYPGHNYLLKFLLTDLMMRDHTDELRRIFERALAATNQDQIVIFVTASGKDGDQLVQRTFARTIYHQLIDGQEWSGIQITTAAGVCAVLDLLREGKLPSEGFVKQEDVEFADFIKNRFGRYYAVSGRSDGA